MREQYREIIRSLARVQADLTTAVALLNFTNDMLEEKVSQELAVAAMVASARECDEQARCFEALLGEATKLRDEIREVQIKAEHVRHECDKFASKVRKLAMAYLFEKTKTIEGGARNAESR